MARRLFSAGDLRHRITIQERLEEQDSETGDISYVWSPVAEWTSLPASIEPLSAREFMAAQAQQSGVTARIRIRYIAGVTAKHRAVDEFGRTWNIKGVLADQNSGIEYLTMPCEEGVNDG